MAREFSKKFYHSKAWSDTQKAFMTSRNYICERCGNAAVIVHHKEHLTPENITNPNVALDWSNLQALCMDCHAEVHAGIPTQPGLMFDDRGNLVRCRDTKGY